MEHFASVTNGGVVLYQHSFGNSELLQTSTDKLIKFHIIGKGPLSSFDRGSSLGYKCLQDNVRGIFFILIFQKLLSNTLRVDDILHTLADRFLDAYGPKETTDTSAMLPFDTIFHEVVDSLIRAAPTPETKDVKEVALGAKPDTPDSDSSLTETPSPIADLDLKGLSQMMKASGGDKKQRPGTYKPRKTKTGGDKKPTKAGRRWDGMTKEEKEEIDRLTVNKKTNPSPTGQTGQTAAPTAAHRMLTDDTINLDDVITKSGLFSGIKLGGTLSSDDIARSLKPVRQRLMERNVAPEVADAVCDRVWRDLQGTSTGVLTSIPKIVAHSVRETVRAILKAKGEAEDGRGRAADVVQGALIHKANREQKNGPRGPFVAIFVGVNGVGKSTSLAKVAKLCTNEGLKVAIAACDTFRSGAIQQLQVHATALDVELIESQYGTSPARIAERALKHATATDVDVLLVDSAGRMPVNEKLMAELTNLVDTASPHLVLFVGEALVGGDAVTQLEQFQYTLKQYSQRAEPHRIDGIILTKFDAVEEKVGAALNMVHTTHVPIMYVGTGQSYMHIATLNEAAVVRALLA